MAIAVFILIILVSIVIFVLVDINHKLPSREFGEEALWRDRKIRAALESYQRDGNAAETPQRTEAPGKSRSL
jgi:hypothetical protein